MPTPPGQTVFRLRVALLDVAPTVWRRLLVPGGIRLARLHDVLQVAMGWTNSHLHSFRIGDELYGTNFDDYSDDEIDEKSVTIVDAIRKQRRFVYQYDFGDSWEHEVVVEEMAQRPGTEIRGASMAITPGPPAMRSRSKCSPTRSTRLSSTWSR